MRTFALSLLPLLYLTFASQAQAGVCLTSPDDGNGKLCTANDFELVSEELVSGPSSCTEGEMIPGDVVVRIGVLGNRTSTYDIGFFVGDGDNSPIDGQSCTFDSLAPLEGANPFDGLSGSGPYRDLDGNSCGDAAKNDGTIFKHITLSNVLCQDSNNDGALDVKYALTWKQSASVCDDPTNPDNFDLATSSKCINAVGDIGEVPVLPPDPDIPILRVQKIAEPNIISPGEDVDYTINVVNEGPVEITLNSLVDDRFGDLDGVGSCEVPQTIAPDQVYSCSFNKFPSGTIGQLHINVVTGSGTGAGQVVSDAGSAIVQIIDPSNAGIGYLVWNDLNADGIKTENEQGIADVTINLLDADSNVLATTTTNESGYYTFLDLSAGNYDVEVIESGPLANLVRTTANNPIAVALDPGQVFTFANFGYVAAQIALQKSAEPIVVNAPGEPVEFTVQVKNTGVLDVELTDLADDRFGNLFDNGKCPLPAANLTPGDTYSCLFTEQINGAAGDTHTNTVQVIAQDLVEGYQVFAADDATVGIEDPANATIGDTVWLDQNFNGVVDQGEPGLDNVTLALSLDSDSDGSYETLVTTTITRNSGEYAFINLIAGSYQIAVTDVNKILADKFLTTPPEPRDIVLAPGQIFTDADFGYADIPKPAIIVLKIPTQRVFTAPVADVTYKITVLNIGDTPVTIDKLIDSRFGSLAGKGTCTLGLTVTTRNPYRCNFTETITGAPLDIHRNRVTAIASDRNGNIAFDSGPAAVLFIAPDVAAIGDQVWEDLNANGLQDDGEPGIGNVTLELYQGATRIAGTVTDAAGNYAFTNLSAGDYQIRVTDTAGELADKVLTGGTQPLDISIARDEVYSTADFGYAAAAIEVIKEGSRKALIEPSGTVTYTITTRNVGYLDVTLTSLVDDKFGDLSGQGTCSTPIAIAARTSVACQFTTTLTGQATDVHTNTVTAIALDSADNPTKAQSTFEVRFIGINSGAAGYLVWNDENGNGVRETSEPGIGSVTLDLEVDEDNNGTFERKQASVVTSQNGFYAFLPVPSGSWRITVTDQYGVLDGRQLTGGTNPNSFSLAGGQIYTDANFGYFEDGDGPGVRPPPPTAPPQEIPLLPPWALLILVGVTIGGGFYGIRQRRLSSRS